MNPASDTFRQIVDEYFVYASPATPQVIVYMPSISERAKFTFEFIFRQALRIGYQLTDNKSEFTGSSLVKINYSGEAIPGTVHMQPSGLLNETDLKVLKRIHHRRDNMIYFFSTPDHEFHFDLFSSVFYFVSRYEEWLPFIADGHGRFENRASLLYMLGAHRRPMVDYWILEFKAHLLTKFPQLQFPQKKFRCLSTIDVDNVYAYRAKPFVRSLGASAKDALAFNFQNIIERVKTLYFFKKDPFDAYDLQLELSGKHDIPLIYFFLCRHDTEHDRTIDPKHPAFSKLVKEMAKKEIPVGVHPSYFSSTETGLFRKETEMMREFSGRDINYSRQHYLRFDITSTPQHLINAGIKYDFTMGYASDIGFRAGTSMPFYYFSFSENRTLPLMAVPFEVMDGAFYIYNEIKPKVAEKETIAVAEEVKKVNGLFVTVFHDRTFGVNFFPGWKPLYLRLQATLADMA